VASLVYTGNRTTREFVITRELDTKVGQPFRLQTLRLDLVRLENLGVFAATRVLPEGEGDAVRLGFDFREMPPVIVYPSFSYTEENGFSYGPAVSTLNLAGRGIRLSARVFFGGASQRFARLTWPWITGNHVSLDFNGGLLQRDDTLNGFREKSWEFTPWLGTWFGTHGRLRGTVSFFRMNSDVDGQTLDPDNEDHFVRVAGAVGWDTRDSWRDPRHGWLNEVEVWHTGGDGSFWTANLDVRRYQPTARRQHVLLSGLLTLQSGTVGTEVPGYFTYYLGGANSVRGYDVNALGPAVHGKNQAIATAEYNFRLLDVARRDFWKWSFSLGLQLALFSDLGLAWSEADEFAWRRFRGGVGAGVRILVPGAEQVRLDVGWSADGGLHFHFASGNKPTGQRRRPR
jgi:outer membrane protein insertion porin family